MKRRTLLTLFATLLATNLVLLGRFASGCSFAAHPGTPPDDGPRPLILVSIDGFRWDYLERGVSPTLARIAAEGVRAERLIPAFPSKTFPNHYTIVTGLYPEHHGIVSNTMYDPEMDRSFRISDPEAVTDARWWGGEPIWVTAEQQGRKTAAFFWPGSEAPIKGVRPSYWMKFDDTIPGEQRVDQVLAWLDLPPAERPAFVTLYFSDVDHAGHDTGPDAGETTEAIRRVDGYLARLVDGLRARGRYDAVNLMVVSDHGMAPVSRDKVIVLDEYVALSDVRIVDLNPVAMLLPAAGAEERVYEALRKAPHLAVYRKQEVPERFHFRASHRIPALVAVAEDGWSIVTRKQLADRPERIAGGTHGYDHLAPSMGALFVARGPAFKQGEVVAPFSNIHLYNLMASLLDVRPAPNDGVPDSVRVLLRAGAAR